ncbi:hypothetical protein Ahy_B03g063453 [Arachis hypogaea]|uniref:Uncharacterized protein n=1 Tax=Arachis hypogaea TaxID=3818 RepID=A0A444ZXR2_ARAHY|nr:hypothetical protein Ahy_B03g063453 [Arachis hypogaea]
METHIRYYIWLIDSDGTIKPAKISVREAMEWSNGRRIMLKFNNEKQAIREEAGLLSGVLGMLGSDYGNFPIREESWHQITTKDKVYNECVKKRLEEIEQQDESSRVLSQNDSITQAELEAEKLKRKAMKDEAVAEKKKRKAMESALIYLFQWQG